MLRSVRFSLAMMVAAVPAAVFAADRLDGLKVESLVNPVGLDEGKPRFSWVMRSTAPGARQTAYRILVASDPARLLAGAADVWDSGKVASSANIQVEFAGAALAPRHRYHWTVEAWDAQGRSVRADKPAFFETGYLSPQGFEGQWITVRPQAEDERVPLSRAQWVWATGVPADAKFVTFQRIVPLQPNDRVRTAWLTLAAPVHLRHWPDRRDYFVSLGGVMGTAVVDVAGPQTWDLSAGFRSGENVLAIAAPARTPERLIASLVVELEDGSRKFYATDGQWTARTWKVEKLPEEWRTGSASKDALARPVTTLGRFAERAPDPDPAIAKVEAAIPAAHLRTDFRVEKPVARARLYATAAGIYEVHLNGKRVGQDHFAPGWTEYGRRTPYQTYDVTTMLAKGANALGVILGDGWYAGTTGMGSHVFGPERAFKGRLEIEYRDGTTTAVATDGSWSGTLSGPIRTSTFFHGEVYDARREADFNGWANAGFSSPSWRSVSLSQPNVGALQGQNLPPIRTHLQLPSRSVAQPRNGEFVFDVGQNLAGWARLTLPSCPAGTRIRLRFGEMVNVNGTLFTGNMRTARVTDEYICRGSGPEVFEPHFTYRGFRYVELTGWPAGGTPPLGTITAIVVHTDLPFVGSFETSDPTLNRLHQNIVWTARSNLMSLPTDCPQRDERLGWAGDIQLFTPTAAFGIELQTILSSYIQGFVDDQLPDGQFADFAPTGGTGGFHGHFGWGDAGVIIPWHMHQLYGDTRILQKHYDAYKKWVDFRTAEAKNDLNDGWSYGDWVSPPPQTPNKVISPMFHARAADIVSWMAKALGRADDAAKYAAIGRRVRAAFQRAFVKPDGKIESDTQTAYAIALAYDMLPVSQRSAAVEHLVAAVHRANDHVGTGLLGTVHLLPLLSRTGHTDLAYKLLFTDTNPSWIFAVKNGATTIWERWDSWTPEKGPSNLGGMNSYNHYAFGVVGQWMYETIAGLRPAPDAVGWDRFEVFPKPGAGLTSAKATHDTVRGRIGSSWNIINGVLTLEVEIPVHATARVFVPTSDVSAVRARSPGLKPAGTEQGAAVFELGAGTYKFTAPAPNNS